MTGQTVDNAIHQYRHDRDPREPIFEFKRRTLVHFAVDTETVLMTTRLAGSATHFLPFNKGATAARATRPIRRGRTYRTAYLWEEVLQRDSLLDLLARFHPPADRGEARRPGPQGTKESDDLSALPPAPGGAPAGGQLRAARAWGTTTWSSTRPAAARATRSPGSRTGSRRLHDDTQRARLRQRDRRHRPRGARPAAQDTIYQFEHKHGVVQKIDESSRQLAEALESGVPIIITTLQKFPFVSRQLLKLAEERGESGTAARCRRGAAP